MAKDNKQTTKGLEVQATPETASGRFASRVMVSGASDHFVLSFLATDPMASEVSGSEVVTLVSRVYVTRNQAAQIHATLGGVLQRLSDTEAKVAAKAANVKKKP